jgi:signal transduction histidine kinase/CheY-like chemotaxis protein
VVHSILDETLDQAALDGRQKLGRRLTAGLIAGVLLALNVGAVPGMIWLLCGALCEASGWWTSRIQAARDEAPLAQRAAYLASAAAATLNWTAMPVLYWLTHTPAGEVTALALLAGQLIHVQSHAVRSRSLLIVDAGLPCLAFLVLPTVFGGLAGLGLLTVLLAVLNLLGRGLAGWSSHALAQANLTAKRGRAKEASQSASVVLTRVSHELRKPLNGVLGMANALKLTTLDDRQAHIVNTIVSCGDDLMALLNDVLDLSKVESRALTLQARPFDIHGMLRDVADLWTSTAHARGLGLIFEDRLSPGLVLGDRLRIQQIVLHLLVNALKFTEQGEVRITLGEGAAPGGRRGLEIAVHDTGPGLSTEQQARLFEDDDLAQPSSRGAFGGPGLGLILCRRLCTLMGGSMSVESQLGRGSTFRLLLHLPACSEEAAPSPAVETAPELGGLRVLVVEDNDANRAVASAILSGAGIAVSTASDAVEALDQLRWGAYDVVVTDLHMPGMTGMSGVEMMRRIRRGEAGAADVAIMALTSDHRFDRTGFDAVEPKPLQAATLLKTVASLASRSRTADVRLSQGGLAA